jgi:hypothetical protein
MGVGSIETPQEQVSHSVGENLSGALNEIGNPQERLEAIMAAQQVLDSIREQTLDDLEL